MAHRIFLWMNMLLIAGLSAPNTNNYTFKEKNLLFVGTPSLFSTNSSLISSEHSYKLADRSGFVQANGLKIAYESFGNLADPKILLINGTGASMIDWPQSFCKKLAGKGFEVIRFDNRDIGLSTKMDSLGSPDWTAIAPFVNTCNKAPLPYNIMDMVKDAVGLMDALHIRRAHIVGASMGGAIAQLVAINYPDRVLTLTTMSASSGDPSLPAPKPKAVQAMSSAPPATKNKDSLIEYLTRVYLALGSTDDSATLHERSLEHVNRSWYPEGASRQVAAILIADHCDRRNKLVSIKIPVLIIHGDVDPLVNVQAANELKNSIPDSRLIIIKGMGHDFSFSFVDTIVVSVAENARRQKNSG